MIQFNLKIQFLRILNNGSYEKNSEKLMFNDELGNNGTVNSKIPHDRYYNGEKMKNCIERVATAPGYNETVAIDSPSIKKRGADRSSKSEAVRLGTCEDLFTNVEDMDYKIAPTVNIEHNDIKNDGKIKVHNQELSQLNDSMSKKREDCPTIGERQLYLISRDSSVRSLEDGTCCDA